MDQAFVSLMKSFMANDNAARRAAEATYSQALQTNAKGVAAKLLQAMQSSTEVSIRMMSAVLLRRFTLLSVIEAGGKPKKFCIWNTLDAASQHSIKAALLRMLSGEAASNVKRMIAHVIAAIACNTSSPWPEAVQAAVAGASNAAKHFKETGLLLLSLLLDSLQEEIIVPQLGTLLPLLGGILSSIPTAPAGSLAPSAAVDAVRSACCVMMLPLHTTAAAPGAAAPGPKALEQWGRVAQLCVGAALALARAGDELEAREALSAISELLERQHAAMLFSSCAEPTFNAMRGLAADASMEAETRASAAYLVATLAEAAPKTARDMAGRVLPEMVTTAMRMMAEVELDAEADARWAGGEFCGGAWFVFHNTSAAGADEGEQHRTLGAGKGAGGGHGSRDVMNTARQGTLNMIEDPSIDEDDESSPPLAAEGALFRVARAIGGQTMLRHTLEVVKGALAGAAADPARWPQRRSAVMTLLLLAGACPKEFEPHALDIAARFLLPRLADPSQRVRHAACSALGAVALSVWFHGQDPKRAGGAPRGPTAMVAGLAPRLAAVVGDQANCYRVRAQAAMALTYLFNPNFCSQEQAAPVAKPVMVAMCSMIAAPSQAAVTAGLAATSCVARCCDEGFAAFYGKMMPAVKSLMRSQPRPAARTATGAAALPHGLAVRAKAMECVALMGASVGEEAFRADAAEVMGMFQQFYQAQQRAAGPTAAAAAGASPEAPTANLGDLTSLAVAEACSRIAGVLGDDFAPYLPMVLPPLLGSLARRIDVSIQDVDSAATGAPQTEAVDMGGGVAARLNADNPGISSTVLSIRGVGDKRLVLNTAAVQEVLKATQLIHEYVMNLSGSLIPYTQQLAAAMVKLLGFTYYPGVRACAALTVQPLLHNMLTAANEQEEAAGAGAGRPMVEAATAFAQQAVGGLLARVDQEFDMEALTSVADGITSIMRLTVLGVEDDPVAYTTATRPKIAFQDGQHKALVEAMAGQLARSVQRRQQAVAELEAVAEADEEALERLDEEFASEVQLCEFCVDSIGYSCKALKDRFLPLFKQYVQPVVQAWLAPGLQSDFKWYAICAFDDVIEWCGGAASEFVPVAFPHMLQAMGSDDALLRQAAAYGIGQVAQRFPAFLGSACGPGTAAQAALASLGRAIGQPDAKEEDNVDATENAISAMGKVLLHGTAALQKSQAGQQFLAAAPRMWQVWLQQLPLREDPMEADYCHSLLADQVKAGNPALLDAGGLEKVLAVFGTVLDGEDDEEEEAANMASPQTRAKMASVLREFPRERMTGAAGSLSPQQARALSRVFQAM